MKCLKCNENKRLKEGLKSSSEHFICKICLNKMGGFSIYSETRNGKSTLGEDIFKKLKGGKA